MTSQQQRYPRVARFRSPAELQAHLATLDSPIPLDDSYKPLEPEASAMKAIKQRA